MREIKFRAWDKDFGHWCSNGLPNVMPICDDGKTQYLKPMGNIIICQFTGLKDKNGKEIYEGDILRLADDSFNRDWRVVWLKSGFWLEPITNLRNWGDWLCNRQDIEVIGNIYENSELLEY